MPLARKTAFSANRFGGNLAEGFFHAPEQKISFDQIHHENAKATSEPKLHQKLSFIKRHHTTRTTIEHSSTTVHQATNRSTFDN